MALPFAHLPRRAVGNPRRPTLFATLLTITALFAPALVVLPASGATISLTLYTNTNGWGWGSANITSPGPTITVNEGDTVDITLVGTDTAWHNFFVDYNANAVANAGSGEPVSADFRSPNSIVFTFTADLAGTFTYYCGYHWRNAFGTFIVIGIPPPVNTPPNATLLAPALGSSFSGGSVHAVTWNMSDAEDPLTNLTAFINYSSSAGTGSVVGPISGSTNPHSFNWTVPRINTTNLRLNLTVLDSKGRRGFSERLVGEVDSIAPRVTFVSPLNGTLGVDPAAVMQVGFSEGMNRTAAEASLSLAALPSGAPALVNILGWTGNAMLFSAALPLANDTRYSGTVAASAQDDSDPGNPVTPFSWEFRTRNNPPTGELLSPAPGLRLTGGMPHDIAFSVSDGEDPAANLSVVLSYAANPASPLAPFTPIAGALAGDSSPFAWTAPLDTTNTARLRLGVTDASGLSFSTLSAAFSLDSTAPLALSAAPGNGTALAVLNTRVVVSFSESMDVPSTASPDTVALFDVGASLWVPGTFRWSSSHDILVFTPAVLLAANSTYRIVVNLTARDASDPGNPLASPFSSSFVTADFVDTQPPTIISSAITPPSSGSTLPIGLSVRTFDDTQTAEVWANLTGALGEPLANVSLSSLDGARWSGSIAAAFLGDQFVTFWACDIAGNCAQASGSFTLTDVTPPSLSRVRGEPALPIVPSTIRVSASASDASGIREVWFVLGSQDQPASFDPATRRYFADLEVTAVGNQTFSVWARDGVGLTNHESVDFTAVDPLPPQLGAPSVVPPVQELGLFTRVSIPVSDNDAVSRVWVEVDGVLNLSLSAPRPLDPYAGSAPADSIGVHTFVLWAEDLSGNRASFEGSFEVVDTTAPSLQHAPVSRLARATSLEIRATAHDLSGAVEVWVAYTGTSGRSLNLSATTEDGANFTAEIPAQNLSGNLTYTVAAVDASGNWKISIPYAVDVPADPDPVKVEEVEQLWGVFSAVAAIAAANGMLAFALRSSKRRARAAAEGGEVPADPAVREKLVDRAVIALFAAAAAGGVAILLTDAHLWDTAPDHAWALVGFTGVDAALAGLMALRRPLARQTGLRVAALWAGLQCALMVADIASAPQYGLTYSQFAVYLFGQPAFVFVLAALSAAGILGLDAAGGLRGLFLGRRPARP